MISWLEGDGERSVDHVLMASVSHYLKIQAVAVELDANLRALLEVKRLAVRLRVEKTPTDISRFTDGLVGASGDLDLIGCRIQAFIKIQVQRSFDASDRFGQTDAGTQILGALIALEKITEDGNILTRSLAELEFSLGGAGVKLPCRLLPNNPFSGFARGRYRCKGIGGEGIRAEDQCCYNNQGFHSFLSFVNVQLNHTLYLKMSEMSRVSLVL